MLTVFNVSKALLGMAVMVSWLKLDNLPLAAINEHGKQCWSQISTSMRGQMTAHDSQKFVLGMIRVKTILCKSAPHFLIEKQF